METREEAWDRFTQKWGPIDSKTRQSARLAAVCRVSEIYIITSSTDPIHRSAMNDSMVPAR